MIITLDNSYYDRDRDGDDTDDKVMYNANHNPTFRSTVLC
jgi:hypothetical protein